jgi:FdhD protein
MPRNSRLRHRADLRAATTAPLARISARRCYATGSVATIEPVAAEVPVALIYNGVSHVVMMATPQDIEDFALGFSLSEAILRRPGELAGLAVVQTAKGIEARMEIDPKRFAMLELRRRNLAGRTGCDAIRRALAALPAAQLINSEARSLHAAAWATPAGEIALIREDVGRHNALDKLIGAMAGGRVDPVAGFALITSRCSVEMVQKAATFAIPTLVAISAPTTLALSLAEETGLRLIAQARADSLTIYTEGPKEPDRP